MNNMTEKDSGISAHGAPVSIRQQAEEQIVGIYYFTGAQAIQGAGSDDTDIPRNIRHTTFCILDAGNFSVIGFSNCAPETKFDAALGQELAYDMALDKLIEMMVFHNTRR